MRKIIPILTTIILTIILAFGLTACGGSSEAPEDTTAAENDATETEAEAETGDTQATADVLVVYFSATGKTKGVAEKIASITGADLYEVKPAREYTSEELDWNDPNGRATQEQNDPDFRTEIGSDPVSLDGYSTIYIGYPIWFTQEPRIMDTFVEQYDFADKTVIPFCTSSSSGIGDSGKNLAENAGSGNWLAGERFEKSVSEEELQTWVNGLQQGP